MTGKDVDGGRFKPGTNYCHRIRAANAGSILVDVRITRIDPDSRCGGCGHTAAEHDLDRTKLIGNQEPGGAGCLRDWTAEHEGCECTQFHLESEVD